MGKKKNRRVGFLAIVVCVLVTLCTVPCGATTVDWNEALDLSAVDTDGYIVVLGTLNLYPGAYVEHFIWAWSGTINIRGGELGASGYIWIVDGVNGYPGPVVTVYGTNFKLDGVPLDSSVTQFAGAPGDLILLTGTYMDGYDIHLLFDFSEAAVIYLNSPPVTMVTIDIKPGSETNPINLKSKGLVPVAVVTTEGFDAAAVDPQTALLAGVAPVRWTMEDVDGDGHEDMLFHFKTQDLATVLTEESTEATLTAETTEGHPIEGTDGVRIVPSKSKK